MEGSKATLIAYVCTCSSFLSPTSSRGRDIFWRKQRLESRKAEADLRYWVAEESVKLAEKDLKQEMNQNQQNKLADKYMDELSQTKGAT